MTRKEAISQLKMDRDLCNFFNPLTGEEEPINEDCRKSAVALDMAVKALEQELILDKIRAEIEELHLIGYATVDGKREIASRAVMQIINKYKAESEED